MSKTIIKIDLIHRVAPRSAILTAADRPLPPFDDDRLRRFEAHVARLRPVFHRADQALRFRAYLRGLLEPTDRKNVESIAAAAGQSMMVEADLAQALQHFVSQSPWDSGRLLAAVRELNRDRRDDPDAVWVVHDTAFAKKGQHSVGVMRQFAREVGKKINCQVGVTVVQLGPRGYFPLASRLYLPAGWLKENSEAAERLIPEEHRRFATKGEIALALLDGLRESGEPVRPVVAEAGYLNDEPLVTGLKARALSVREQADELVGRAISLIGWLKDELGLDHFEGRTWHGWHHHASLVFTAYHWLTNEIGDPAGPPIPTLPR